MIAMNKDLFTENYVTISNEDMNNEQVVRVVKSEKLQEFDENTYAKLKAS